MTCLLCGAHYLANWYAAFRQTQRGRRYLAIVCPAVCPDCGGKERQE